MKNLNTDGLYFPVLAALGILLNAPTQGQNVPADDTHAWAVHDPQRPLPPVVTPGTPSTQEQPGAAPADAVILFDGTRPDADLSAWTGNDGQLPQWTVGVGYFEVAPNSGNLYTRESFGDVQLHVEWLVPSSMSERASQKRGNSGIFLMDRYEVQVLESLGSDTYADGMATAVYGQNPPLANAGLGLDQWQTYDIIFRRPHFDEDGQLTRPASVTVLHNGVLVQDHWLFEGPTEHRKRTSYRPHEDAVPLQLQNHGDPVRYRNIWVRPLPERPVSPIAE